MSVRPRYIVVRLLLGLLPLALGGCQLMVPVIDGFKKAGLTEGDRKNLLKPEVQGFQTAMSSGELDHAIQYLKPEAVELRQALIDEMRRTKHKEKVVDSRIDFMIFSEDAHRAEVEVLVKYFEIPYYVVNQRIEKGVWEFELSGGWKLVERTFSKVKE
ncbi:MAG: hypothetical protein GX589_07600 [Deltaproteobacteria bacterium]|mgnify:CR=1 FL=1|nr:hypothetical protein [Deltaproteobacteria bacterium]